MSSQYQQFSPCHYWSPFSTACVKMLKTVCGSSLCFEFTAFLDIWKAFYFSTVRKWRGRELTVGISAMQIIFATWHWQHSVWQQGDSFTNRRFSVTSCTCEILLPHSHNEMCTHSLFSNHLFDLLMKLLEMALLVSVGITLQEYFITYYVEHYLQPWAFLCFQSPSAYVKKSASCLNLEYFLSFLFKANGNLFLMFSGWPINSGKLCARWTNHNHLKGVSKGGRWQPCKPLSLQQWHYPHHRAEPWCLPYVTCYNASFLDTFYFIL